MACKWRRLGARLTVPLSAQTSNQISCRPNKRTNRAKHKRRSPNAISTFRKSSAVLRFAIKANGTNTQRSCTALAAEKVSHPPSIALSIV